MSDCRTYESSENIQDAPVFEEKLQSQLAATEQDEHPSDFFSPVTKASSRKTRFFTQASSPDKLASQYNLLGDVYNSKGEFRLRQEDLKKKLIEQRELDLLKSDLSKPPNKKERIYVLSSLYKNQNLLETPYHGQKRSFALALDAKDEELRISEPEFVRYIKVMEKERSRVAQVKATLGLHAASTSALAKENRMLMNRLFLNGKKADFVRINRMEYASSPAKCFWDSLKKLHETFTKMALSKWKVRFDSPDPPRSHHSEEAFLSSRRQEVLQPRPQKRLLLAHRAARLRTTLDLRVQPSTLL